MTQGHLAAAPATLQRFLPLQGQQFEFRADGAEPWLAELVDVVATGGPAFQGRAPFSLLFRGPPQPVQPQQTYRVDHEAMPRMDIFLVPVGADPVGVRYEAVFN